MNTTRPGASNVQSVLTMFVAKVGSDSRLWIGCLGLGNRVGNECGRYARGIEFNGSYM